MTKRALTLTTLASLAVRVREAQRDGLHALDVDVALLSEMIEEVNAPMSFRDTLRRRLRRRRMRKALRELWAFEDEHGF